MTAAVLVSRATDSEKRPRNRNAANLIGRWQLRVRSEASDPFGHVAFASDNDRTADFP
jgi:hypothetical protein